MNSRRLAELLADGKPRNVVEMSEALGLTEREIWNALGHASRYGRVKPLPGIYTLTPIGKEYVAGQVPDFEKAEVKRQQRAEWQKQYKARKRAYRASQPKPPRIPKEPPATVPLMEQALAKRNPLEAAWGWSPFEHQEAA